MLLPLTVHKDSIYCGIFVYRGLPFQEHTSGGDRRKVGAIRRNTSQRRRLTFKLEESGRGLFDGSFEGRKLCDKKQRKAL